LIKGAREESRENLEKHVKYMKHKSDANFPDPAVGDNVRVRVRDVDWCKTDARSIIACVLEQTADNFYKLGTRTGSGAVVEQQLHNSNVMGSNPAADYVLVIK